MLFSRRHNGSHRLLALLAVSLYALALVAGALHPMLHEASEAEHVTYGICGTGCEEHHTGAEECNTCATLTKKVSRSVYSVVAFAAPVSRVIVPVSMAVAESTDTQLPGLRAPPATA